MKNFAIYRIYRIVWMSIKFFVQVMFFQRRYKGRFTPIVNLKWEKLVTKQAKEYKKTALQLGGLMIKVGQFLSTRADIMPPSFIEELEGLTDRVPSVPKEQAMDVLKEEWNAELDDFVSNLSEQPVASASIGEVYKGTLKNGETVAIKIQRPGIERIIRIDFRAMKIVIWLVRHFTKFSKQLDFNLLYKEMVNTIAPELNFLQELQNGRNFSNRYGHLKGIRFPVYYDEFSTRRVLVMEWIEGSRISDIAYLETHQLDRSSITKRLFLLFLEQVLEGGEFHADPHAGNILIQADGTIVLIDFGMVGSITKEQSQSIVKVVEGIIFSQYDQVLDGLEELQFLLPEANRTLLADAIARLVSAYESNELKEMDNFVVERLLTDLKEIVRTQPVQLPAEFAFFGRAISTLVGVLYILDPNVDLLALGKPRILEWTTSKAIGGEKVNFSAANLLKLGKKGLLPLRKISTFLEEPTKMREYMQKRDEQILTHQLKLQSRLFSGISMMIGLTTFFVGLGIHNQTLMIYASLIFVVAGWMFRKK
ncbi:putative unusual protein kinase regulating ubiquinone biosynthesis (AarF/ABC1/UbiB family) [Psychrobacillus insolitus]|uniref:Putative unusual protein kinase regulating ubiquinone biosynthesis (AarF/ABC1/UbiB family) n=1 Tax=Psychrobacillus insolitus TaxID=1461 RepID=A0A2W7PDE4_9BACI|nr:AarF/UbiB family protein [Psychrobacillus insolitus]PZX05717.1 putative unusual protein kinase regulating ubiquinone biosynthesis (AarF/ABC1/UbiB family) [Psychrobacillus insolitus]